VLGRALGQTQGANAALPHQRQARSLLADIGVLEADQVRTLLPAPNQAGRPG
jgi:hypothetical protein